MRSIRDSTRTRGPVLALLMALALVLTACPAEEPEVVEPVEPVEEPVEEPPEPDVAEFEDVTLRVGVETGHALGDPIKPYVAEWEEMSGATVEITEIPFAEIFPRMMTSFMAGTDDFDVVIVLPTWLGDMNPFLEPLNAFIEGDEVADWDDILPVCQEIARWEGQTFLMPLDCDLFMSYYNRTALEDPDHQTAFEDEYGYPLAPPTTWDEYRDVAAYFEEHDDDLYGAMESMSRGTQTFWTGLSRMVGYVSQGEGWELFFDPDDMTPLINSPGHVRALEEWIEIVQHGPPDILEFDVGDIRAQFPLDTAALALDWASIGFIPTSRENQELIGFNPIPGPMEVYDHATGEWIELDEPNRVPFMAANGWGAAIPGTSPNQEAAWDLIRYLASPDISLQLVSMRDNYDPAVGYQPFRGYHFENVDGWVESEWDRDRVEEYLDATYESLTSEFVQPDLRIPGAFEYLDELDAGVTAALTGEMTPQAALDDVADRWDAITEREGRDEQLRLYRASIGLD
ncbi:MAG: extracellular solute-binding protein [Nitriliruptor sp.]|nr:MAG: extracellular solute-binding protein [Nitriliruptor sp.]